MSGWNTQAIGGVIFSSGNSGSGFQTGTYKGSYPGPVDALAPPTLGQFYYPQQWLFSQQTKNWWPPYFTPPFDEGAPPAPPPWFLMQQNADNLMVRINIIKSGP